MYFLGRKTKATYSNEKKTTKQQKRPKLASWDKNM